MTHRRPVLAAAVAALLLLGACGSDDGDDDAAPPTTDAAATPATDPAPATTPTTTPPEGPLEILVSNDDGYAAEGIDALVEGLTGLDDVEVTVVAPLEQQSGQGGKRTEGPLDVTDVTLASGHPATAVDGFPADAVRVALDERGVQPDLVVTGINEGQNVGPFVDVSGTIGAARAAVARGVPALATSQGTGADLDYDVAVPLVLEWVTEHRVALAAGEEPVAVTNLNVPSCDAGEVRGLADEVSPDADADAGVALGPQDCTSTEVLDPEAGDVAAFVIGYATLSTVPAEPAVAPEVVPAGG